MEEFTGFEKEELAAFLRHAWTQDDFTPLRKRVIKKLELLVGQTWRTIRNEHEGLGFKLVESCGAPGPENDGTVEAAWVALIRNAQAQRQASTQAKVKRKMTLAPRDKSAFYTSPCIVARVDADGLFVGFGLPRTANPDADLFLSKWKTKSWRASFLEGLQKLPSSFVFGDNQGMMIEVQSLAPASLNLAIDAFSQGVGWLMIGRKFTEEQSLHEPSTVEMEITEHAKALVSLYELIAFCPKIQVRPQAPKRGRGARSERPKRNGKGSKPKDKKEELRTLDRPAQTQDIVKIHQGMFAGKVGRVVSDREDAVEVRLGRLPVWIPKKDVWVLAPKD